MMDAWLMGDMAMDTMVMEAMSINMFMYGLDNCHV